MVNTNNLKDLCVEGWIFVVNIFVAMIFCAIKYNFTAQESCARLQSGVAPLWETTVYNCTNDFKCGIVTIFSELHNHPSLTSPKNKNILTVHEMIETGNGQTCDLLCYSDILAHRYDSKTANPAQRFGCWKAVRALDPT